LWRSGRKRRVDPDEFRPLPCCRQKCLKALIEILNRSAATILEPERKPDRVPQSGNRRRTERKSHSLRYVRGQLPIDVAEDSAGIHAGCGSLVPWFKRDEIKSVVGSRNASQQAESIDCREVCDAGSPLQNTFDLASDRIRALERCCRRQLNVQKE